jgi:hypothetical protein
MARKKKASRKSQKTPKSQHHVLHEPFSHKQHILFTKLSVLAYEPPLGFLLGMPMLDATPEIFNKEINKELSILDGLINKGIKNGMYCGTLKGTDTDVHGFFVSNRHDLNCYIVRLDEDDPDIYVIFRGTTSTTQWKSNFSVLFEKGHLPDLLRHFTPDSEGKELIIKMITLGGKPYIYPGFAATLFASLDIINYCVLHLLKERRGKSNIYVTGHSLGGALAKLYGFAVAYALAEYHGELHKHRNKINLPINVCSLGAPKVGNQDFSTIYNALIEIGLIRYDRAVSVTRFFSDPITSQPPDLASWVTKISGHPGFPHEKEITCRQILKKVEEDELAQALMSVSDLPHLIQQHCAREKKIKLVDPQAGNLVLVEATKDESKDCPGFAASDIHGVHGFGLCHAWYFGISFTHLAGYALVRRRVLAGGIFHLGEFSSALGILKNGAVATKVVGDRVDPETKRYIDKDQVEPVCRRDQAKLV